jgi:hypothetical protein
LFYSDNRRGWNLDAIPKNTSELNDYDFANDQIVFCQDMPQDIRA